MLVVLSDHGEEFHDHGGWEHGHTLFQELTRIPLVVKLPRQKRGEIRGGLFAISQVAGLIRSQYGLSDAAGDRREGDAGEKRPLLELSLPVSPFRSASPGKVSFVENDYQFIHDFLPPQPGPGPEAAARSDEWFTVADAPAVSGEPFSPSPALHSRGKKLLAAYILRLKALKRNTGRIDADLLEKLKALGYLGD
jgi:arylsulfatase A-like enzyme